MSECPSNARQSAAHGGVWRERARARRACASLFFVGLLGVTSGALAHPHVWVSYAADLRMKGDTIKAIAETWRFTNGFPVQIIGLNAQPKDGPASAEQTATFKAQAFDSLGRVGYYNHLYVDGAAQRLDGPTDFRVSVEGGDVVYRFTLRLPSPVTIPGHTVALGIWDPSFFVDYEAEGNAPDKAVRLAAVDSVKGTSKCTAKTFADSAHPIFAGMVIPKAVAISCAP